MSDVSERIEITQGDITTFAVDAIVNLRAARSPRSHDGSLLVLAERGEKN